MFLQDEFISLVPTPRSQLFQHNLAVLLWPWSGNWSHLKNVEAGGEREGIKKKKKNTTTSMLCGFCFVWWSQIWSSVWLCKQSYWHRCRAGSSILNKHGRGRLRCMKSRPGLTVHLCSSQAVLLAHSCWFSFSCFIQTSSLSLRYEISFNSFVGYRKSNIFKYGWVYTGCLSGHWCWHCQFLLKLYLWDTYLLFCFPFFSLET